MISVALSGICIGNWSERAKTEGDGEIALTNPAVRSLWPDLQKHIGFDGDLPAEWPVMADDQ